ncbi:MAG: helix-hairpin-helix domain-containing protein [Candidatus Kuenenia sp.]|nr:helix-hairpin-helix domain-containing protein [Candidatus Kuenenia hertensis]
MHKMQKRVMVVLLMFAVAFVVGQSKVSFAKAKPKLQGHVNINTATEAQLAMLPGVGDKLAKKIIEHRTKIGPFKTLEEIKTVKGVKDKKLEKFKEFLILEGETTIEVVKDN